MDSESNAVRGPVKNLRISTFVSDPQTGSDYQCGLSLQKMCPTALLFEFTTEWCRVKNKISHPFHVQNQSWDKVSKEQRATCSCSLSWWMREMSNVMVDCPWHSKCRWIIRRREIYKCTGNIVSADLNLSDSHRQDFNFQCFQQVSPITAKFFHTSYS